MHGHFLARAVGQNLKLVALAVGQEEIELDFLFHDVSIRTFGAGFNDAERRSVPPAHTSPQPESW